MLLATKEVTNSNYIVWLCYICYLTWSPNFWRIIICLIVWLFGGLVVEPHI